MNASESNQYNEQLMEIQNAIDLKKKKKSYTLKKNRYVIHWNKSNTRVGSKLRTPPKAENVTQKTQNCLGELLIIWL